MTPPLLCFRHLADEHKEASLYEAVRALSSGEATPTVYAVQPEDFKCVPGAPFAYWVGKSVRELFATLPSAESDNRKIALGLSTKNDTRFVRVWWEVEPSSIGRDKKWANYANGGSFSPFYFSYPAVVLAENDCAELRTYLVMKFPYLAGNAGWILHDENEYRSPVIAWPLRTHAFSPAFLPSDFFFSARTYAAVISLDKIATYVGVFASNIVDFLLKVSLGRTGHPEFVTGVVRSLPIPLRTEGEHRIGELSLGAWRIKKLLNVGALTAHEALLPSLLTVNGPSLSARSATWGKQIAAAAQQLVRIQAEIDGIAMRLYGLTEEDLGKSAIQSQGSEIQLEDGLTEDGEEENAALVQSDLLSLVIGLLDYLIGGTFGRWDIRFATGQRAAPELPDPFAPLPVCPPGMLQGLDGLPAKHEELLSDYPIRISWDGIIVDDQGFNGAQPHQDDIVRRMREVLDLLWKDKAHEIEQEVCDILGVSDLRDYFRKSSGFFQDHLKRYSKSRRKAPIYWPLSTASGSYTIWLYYHRLTEQTLYAAVNKYIEPKIAETERGIGRIEDDVKTVSGRDTTRLNDRLNEARTFLGELRELREELLRIASLPFKPNLNDGVIINAAPFHNLFRLRPWAKDTEDCWKILKKGDYDWAHLAYTIWPDRVREVCKTDRSIAIAHGLEELYITEAPAVKKTTGRRKKS